MRRAAALSVVLVLAACSDVDRPPIERVSGSIGPSAVASGEGGFEATSPADDGFIDGDGNVIAGGGSASGGGPGTAGTGGTGGTSGTGGAGGSAGTGGSTAGGTGGSTATGGAVVASTPEEASRIEAATQALNAYFDALQAEDFLAARRASADGPQLMAVIRSAVARFNAERDGRSELSYSSRSFEVASHEAERVTFTGSARLESTVSGPAGDPVRESVLFENPVVTLSNGSWHVVDYQYDGHPIEAHPSTARRTVGGVKLRLTGALSYGGTTALVIDLESDRDRAIKVEGVQLRYDNGSSAAPRRSVLISRNPAALYFSFARSTARPVSWTGTVVIDGGTPQETREDVVLSF